ncbi:hypothetical protein JYT51_02520 [Candidatus Amoebophilus asiaticus]|nr:hypothetical protein [Candidatus Amoebophilus asiaticus]
MKTIMKNYRLLFPALILLLLGCKKDTEFTPKSSQEILEEKISHEWVLQNGWFTAETVTFEIIESADYEEGLHDAFTFTKDNQITHEILIQDGLGYCGTGMLYIREGYWKINDNIVVIHLIGGNALVSCFEISVKYEINQLDERIFELKRISILLEENKSYWECD